jgi:hypothetical protein
MKERQKYDFARLEQYCKENNVVLLEDYSNRFLTRSSIINAKCAYKNCDNSFEKNLYNIINIGAYCKKCIKIISVNRAKATFLEKYGSENILQLDFVKKKSNPNKFTFQKLKDYCIENNIDLCGDYSECHLTKKSCITAKCQSIECNETVEKVFREIEKRGIYCKNCSNKIKKDKTINTCLEKYGVVSPSKTKEVKEKYNKTCLQKYGVKHSFQSENVKNKIKKTMLQRYGVENPTKNEEIKNKIQATNLKKYGCTNTLHSETIKEKVKLTMLEKYGVENISQNNDIKNKKIETCIKNWGVQHPSQNQVIQEKIKQTNIINLGVEYPTQNKEVKNKRKETNLQKFGVECTFQNENVKNKIKETNLQKLGVEYPTQNKEVKNKIIKTALENWGVEHPSQNVNIKTKTKDTNLLKYGVECPLQNELIKEKTKQTNLLKYGVEYPIQNSEIMEKHIKSSYSKKEYIFPSGKVENIQGYENYAINDLIINENIDESDIIIGVKNVPEVWYNYNNKEHRYYVDIYIPSQNKCIEVKSLYTFNDNKIVNLLKKEAAEKMGYNFEFWIYDNKGNKTCYD